MPISATGNRREHGFTLVELMVVIAIMAIAIGIVALNLPESQGRVRAEAEGLAARMLAARDDAIIQSRDIAVWVTRDGYGMERRRRGLWQPISERPFDPVRFRDGTTAAVGVSGRERLVFDTTGAVDMPVKITIARPSGQATVNVSTDGSIRVGS